MSKYLLIAVTFLATNNLKAGDARGRLFSSAAETAAAGAPVTPARLDRPAEITPTRSGCFSGLFRSTSPKNNSSVSPRDFDQGASTSPTLLTDHRLPGALVPVPVHDLHEAARLAAERAARVAEEKKILADYVARLAEVGWEHTLDVPGMLTLTELPDSPRSSDSSGE